MLSVDTNLLLYAYESSCSEHERAYSFLSGLVSREDVGISEFVLVELYHLLRNPAVVERPLKPLDAVAVIQAYRSHPRWRLLSFPNPSSPLMEQVWKRAADPLFARRRIYDLRLALILRGQGVSEFATANTKDFDGLGFHRVWNPLA